MRDPHARHYGNKEIGRSHSRRSSVTGLGVSQGKAGEGMLGIWENLRKSPEVETTWSVWGPQRAHFSAQKVKELTRNIELSTAHRFPECHAKDLDTYPGDERTSEWFLKRSKHSVQGQRLQI